MIFTSPIISAGSGSIAGFTVSRNRGGLYARARAVPTNPNSVPQQAVRQGLAVLNDSWINTLTVAQRSAWEVYAVNTPVFNRLGAQILLTGQQFFIANNVSRLQGSQLAVLDAPVIFNRGSFFDPTFVSITASTDQLSLAFDNADEWANETGSFMFVYASRPANPSINYFKGPYQLAGTIFGDDTTPPATPATIALPFGYSVGQRGFIKVNVARVDGRYSQPFRGTVIAT